MPVDTESHAQISPDMSSTWLKVWKSQQEPNTYNNAHEKSAPVCVAHVETTMKEIKKSIVFTLENKTNAVDRSHVLLETWFE